MPALLKVTQNVLLKNPSVKKKVGSYLKELAVSAPHGTTAGAMKVTAKLEKAGTAQNGVDKLAVCTLDLKVLSRMLDVRCFVGSWLPNYPFPCPCLI